MIVTYINEDEGQSPNPIAFMEEVGRDAAARRSSGWRLASVAVWPMRQMGTAGNILFQSGGQYATQLAVIATYLKETPSPPSASS